MEETLRVNTNGGRLDRELALDWLTALVPIFLVSFYYYRWRALALAVLAVGGYLMAECLLAHPCGRSIREPRLARAVASGLLVAFCLPATTPFWPAALMAGIAALFASLPSLISRKWPNSRLAFPLISPVLLAFLVIRLAFPAAVTGYTVPAQWSGVDTITTATPLAALNGEPLQLATWQLLFGVHAGTLGETCAPAIGLSFLFLLTRRRVRLATPVAMLTVLSLCSLLFWHSPLYGILAGSSGLVALLLADRRYAPTKISEQLLVGGLAGLLTALWRLWGPWAEGTAVAALVAQLFTPFAPAALRGLKALWRLIRRLLRRGLSLLRQKIAHFTTARRTPHTSAPGAPKDTPKDTPFETK